MKAMVQVDNQKKKIYIYIKTVGVPTRFSHSKAKKDKKIPFWSSFPSELFPTQTLRKILLSLITSIVEV